MTQSTATAHLQVDDAPKGAQYRVWSTARNGGVYNSHLVSGVLFAGLAATGTINVWLASWVCVCIAIGIILDRRSWNRKVNLIAMPGQMFLYVQVLLQAAMQLLPYYAAAFVIYVCIASWLLPLNFAVSSFVMLYTFYMVLRSYFALRYLWVLQFHWDNAGRTFNTKQANLKSQSSAIQHVLWAYFLGNVGLVVRCSSQVLTIAGFEFLRQWLSLDLAEHPVFRDHLTMIFTIAIILWIATFWWAMQPTFLVYYKAHRTLHACRPLYDSVHSVHHRGVFPTKLDSGTISPLEFLITEMTLPAATLVPNWHWALIQAIVAVVGHFPGHESNTTVKFGHHHLAHHRYFNVNFGLTSREDIRFGTHHVTSASPHDG